MGAPARAPALPQSPGAGSFLGGLPPVVLDHRVGGWEERGLVAVFPPDHVGRAAVIAVDLDDRAMTILVALVTALDRQLISDRSFHGSPLTRRYLPGLSTGQSVKSHWPTLVICTFLRTSRPETSPGSLRLSTQPHPPTW